MPEKIKLIDVCGGTGDISLQILNHSQKTRFYQKGIKIIRAKLSLKYKSYWFKF